MANASQNILDKHFLAFEFNINHVQFNHQGRYFLRLAVCSSFSTKDYSSIKIQKNKARSYEVSRQVDTDTVTQAELKAQVKFKDYRFTFFLPKGFCKNDKNHDVYLQIEAYAVDEGEDESTAKKVGEAQFAIYPRTNHPKVNIYAEMETNMFRKEDVISLFRTASTDNVKMHCGRLKYAASFRKVRKMPENYEKASPTATPIVSTAVSPAQSKLDEHEPSSPLPDMTGDNVVLPATPDDDPDYGHRSEVDENILADNFSAFEFDVYHGQFNKKGVYFLRLAICSNVPDTDLSGIKVQINKEGTCEPTQWTQTDKISQVELRRSYKFRNNRFTFFLPKDLCKNEKKHRVYLQIDAFSVENNSKVEKAGAAQCYIYPRRIHPMVDVHTEFEELMFRIEDVINLYKDVNEGNTKFHTGRLKYMANYRKIRAMPGEESETPAPLPVYASPEPESDLDEATPEEPETQEPEVEEREPTPEPQEPDPVLEESDMAYDFSFHNVQFKSPGRYFLRLAVCSNQGDKDYSGVKVQTNKEGPYESTADVTTESAMQEEPASDIQYGNQQWTFYLPKGFCNDNKEDETYLKIDAFALGDNCDESEAQKVGEARVDIYPHHDPKANVEAEPNEDMYSKEDVLNLVAESDPENVSGQMRFTGSLRKISEMPQNSSTEEQSPDPIPVPDEHMAFEFDFCNPQFDSPGRYVLRFTLCSSLDDKDFSEIIVEKDNSGMFVRGHEVDMEIDTEDEHMSDMKNDHRLTFFIPKGFIGEEPNDDVYLKTEVFVVGDGMDKSGEEKIGEAKFDVFPRENPTPDVDADVGEDMYEKQDVMDVVKDGDGETLCGRLDYISSLRKVADMPEESTAEPALVENVAFDINLSSAQLSVPGNYFLRLVIVSSSKEKDLGGIRVEKNNERRYNCTHEATTDVFVHDDALSETVFTDNKWTFFLPKGFFDENDAGYLNIELYSNEDGNSKSDAVKAGIAQFDIYPRTNPKAQVAADPMYVKEHMIDFINEDEGTAFGQLCCTGTLRRVSDIPVVDPLDDDSLAFEFNIDSALLHKEGKYFLRLAVCNSSKTRDFGLIKVKSHDKKYGLTSEVSSDTVQVESDVVFRFKDHKWIFILPKGFYQSHDAYLQIDTYTVEGENEPSVSKVGTAQLPVLSKQLILDASTGLKDHIYRKEGVIDVLSIDSPEELGQLNFRASVRKICDIPDDEDEDEIDTLDDSTFAIEYTINNAEFEQLGSYVLRLSICSSVVPAEYSLIKVQSNKGLSYALTKEVKTEYIVQSERGIGVALKTNKWTFILPRGFCKMGARNDIYLQVDAYIDEGKHKDADRRQRKIGTAQFVVSPCTDPSAYAKAGSRDAMFKKEGVMDIYNTEGKCGKLNFSISVLKLRDFPDDFGILREEFSSMVRQSQVTEYYMALEFEINNVKFSRQGNYFMRLTVCSNLKPRQYEIVKMQKNNPKLHECSRHVKTEAVDQAKENEEMKFTDRKWTFILPRELCQVDKDSDVYLQIDAVSAEGKKENHGKKVGECQFVVYPSAEHPNLKTCMKIKTFQENGIIRMVQAKGKKAFGQLKYTATFRRIRMTLEDYEKLYPPSVPESSSRKLADNARSWGREKSDLHVKLQEAELGLRRSPMATDYNPKVHPGWAMLPKENSRTYSKAPPSTKAPRLKEYR